MLKLVIWNLHSAIIVYYFGSITFYIANLHVRYAVLYIPHLFARRSQKHKILACTHRKRSEGHMKLQGSTVCSHGGQTSNVSVNRRRSTQVCIMELVCLLIYKRNASPRVFFHRRIKDFPWCCKTGARAFRSENQVKSVQSNNAKAFTTSRRVRNKRKT